MFKTKREKHAYVQGIKKGKRGGCLYRKGGPAKKSRRILRVQNPMTIGMSSLMML